MQDIKLSNFGMQSQNDDFIVEFEVASLNAELFNEIDKKIQNVDNQIQSLEDRIAVLNTDIDRLTNHADGLDYAVAVSSGIIAGIIDSVIVGEWDFKSAKAKSNEEINRQIEEYAEKVGCKGKTLEETIAKLEKKFKLPGDSEWNTKTQFIKFAKSKGFIPENVSGTYEDALKFMNENYPKEGGWGVVNTFISASSHHLDDFCHHPTLIGLICNVIVQFTGESIYVNSSSNMFNLPVTINDYGRFEGKNFISKIFSGIINWFLNVAETMANAKGHWMSDLAGSKQTAGGGAGLPGSFMSMMKELSALPIFKDTNFGVNLKKAYEKGIGTSEGQIDLGAFNALFEGANSKFDYRTENAIKTELKRQAMPVIINEVLVRGFYFIRRFINELKIRSTLMELDWKDILPFNNRTITRMITIASGTFMAFDLADAAIRSAIKNKGHTYYNPLFWKDIVLRVNFVGVGRFVVALGVDACSGYKRSMLVKERMQETSKLIMYNNVKIFYLQEKMWIEAKNMQEAINALCDIMEISIMQAIENTKENIENIGIMDSNLKQLEKVDPEFRKELADIAIFSKKE